MPAESRVAFDPNRVILPLFGRRPTQELEFLGTGSIVGPGGLLLTAEHVIRDWRGEFFTLTINDFGKRYEVRPLAVDRAHDLALLKIIGYEPAEHLIPAFDQRVAPNIPVMSMEYGTTTTVGKKINLHPAHRMGNVVRQFAEIDRLGPAGHLALELSFPALKGASGAPVVAHGRNVWGVIVSNVSYELLPCQIESVLDEKNQIFEEIKFMLPQALAVSIQHLKPLYHAHVHGS